MSQQPTSGDRNTETDDPVAALLRTLREEPTPERRMRVEANVRAAWHDALGDRRRRRGRHVVVALAAAIGVATLAAWLGLRDTTSSLAPLAPAVQAGRSFATIASIEGQVFRRSARVAQAQPVRVGDELQVGDRLETASGRLGLTLASGADLRLDTATSLAITDRAAVTLDAGALYYDNHAAGGDASIHVATRFGTATDIGTRFALRVGADALRLAVRDGEVAVTQETGSLSAGSGVELVVSDTGEVVRRSITAFDPTWSWIAAVAPGFDLNGASLASFIAWLEHESGWQVRFRDEAVARGAAEWILSGPGTAGMAFEDALALTMQINNLRFALDDGVVTIEEGE